MSSDINSVALSGRVAATPTIREIGSSGTKVLNFRVATSEWSAKSKKEYTSFVSVQVWGRQAEWLEPKIFKGSRVLLNGRLAVDEYETKDGAKKSFAYVKTFDPVYISLSTSQKQEERVRPTEESDDLPF